MKTPRSLSILLALQLIGITLCAQNLDSLLKVYKSKVPHDVAFTDLLLQLSKHYGQQDLNDSSLAFAKRAYALSEKIGYKKGIAISLNYIGIGYFFKGDYPKAQQYQQKTLEYATVNHFNPQRASAQNSLALALEYQGNYFAALDSYLKALQLEEGAKNNKGQLKVLSNISSLWKKLGNLEKALDYNKRALQLCDSLSDSRLYKSRIYNNLGTILSDQKKDNEALVYFQKTLKLNLELQNETYTSLSNLGDCYLRLNLLIEAENYTKQSLKVAREYKSDEIIEKDLSNLADIYLKQHKLAEALALAKESLSMSVKSNNRENMLQNYRGLSSIYIGLGNLSLANEYLEKTLALNDSLKNSELIQKISDLQKSYELNKKEIEINLLEKDAALKKASLKEERDLRYGLIGLIAGLFVFAGVIYYGFSIKASLSRKLQKQNNEILVQKELIERINRDLKAQALRAQMNPHFIFNSLNSIQFLIMKMESTKAFDYLAKFALLLRKVMDNSENNLVSLTEEIEILNLYLELESLRFDGTFDYKIESSVENMNSKKVPPLVVQPYIENAILHGLMPKEAGRELSVTFFQENGSLVCEINDNGIGRAAAMEISKRKNKLFASKGMNYTAERIEVMNKMHNAKSEINIVDLMENGEAAGTRVRILFAYA